MHVNSCAPDSSLGRYLASCSWLALRTSWLMHRLVCAPYDSATAGHTCGGAGLLRSGCAENACHPYQWPTATLKPP